MPMNEFQVVGLLFQVLQEMKVALATKTSWGKNEVLDLLLQSIQKVVEDCVKNREAS